MNLKDSLNLYEMTGDLLPESRMKTVLASANTLCGCGCLYSGQPGGSSTEANCAKNAENGLRSPGPIECIAGEIKLPPTGYYSE